MGSCREILTLQLGTYANYVGSHLWSLQEMGFNYTSAESSDICHDVLFREGLNIRNEITFTPRVICVENEARVAPIPILQDECQSLTADILASAETFDTGTEEPHQFIKDLDAGVESSKVNYAFEKTARGWGDFLRTKLHPRSVLLDFTSFDDELEDRIRIYIEECDNLQGFQVIADVSQYYSGVQQFLEDEYSSKYRLYLPVLSPSPADLNRKDINSRCVQVFRNLSESSVSSTLTVPLSCLAELSPRSQKCREFNNLLYDGTDLYQTSAILASFIDTISLCYRTRATPTHMSDALAGLTARGWKFNCASLALPFGIPPSSTLREYLESRNDETPLWEIATPSADANDSWYQVCSMRGCPDTDREVFQQYLQYLSSTITSNYSHISPMPTLQPFPKIFSPHVSMRGSVDLTAARVEGFEVMSTPVLAALHVGPGIGDMLANLVDISSNIDLRQLPHIDIENDLYQECIHNMKALVKDHSCLLDID